MTGEKRQQFSSRLYHDGGNIIRSNDGNARHAVMTLAPERRQDHLISLGQRGQIEEIIRTVKPAMPGKNAVCIFSANGQARLLKMRRALRHILLRSAEINGQRYAKLGDAYRPEDPVINAVIRKT